MTNWEERRADRSKNGKRTEYERDFARVVHSAAFRRLQAKTQVLGMGDSDFNRTRLTHSMEVSQIGVAITKKLYREQEEGSPERAILPPPMLMSTICLAHDLGHPPFGHGGEVALNRCMLPYGGFEGNGQTLRIVTKLEPYSEQFGMDLTKRAVLGVIKYPAPYDDVVDWNNYPGGKPATPPAEEKDKDFSVQVDPSSIFVASSFKPPKCYLNEEHDDVVMGWVAADLDDWSELSKVYPASKKGKHPKTKHKSLDTSIMELADDIAYGVHDLEDAVGLGLIRHQTFCQWYEKTDEDTEEVRKALIQPFLDVHHDGKFDDFAKKLFNSGTQERKRVIGHLVGFFVERAKLVRQEKPAFADDIFAFQAVFDKENEEALRTLKEIVVELVIKSTPVQQLEFKGQKIVAELFAVFATDPKRLLDPRDYQRTIQGGGETPTPRVICDYIAGMTDEYATKRYQQLFEPRVGSVFDRL
ncbi:Deoxyguanosinetriphosphate triphosphohydrolase-like protein [Sulfitobacter noctilucicola]|uniref:Deoxyguanosinetriphosphate triphosphohydrolase-like protein n=1 Tax=Sulfitobacter noctilucicola TaxID=1342301 RepID=A0A7W6M5S8_9RHOB|nr:anti-phage deoxyguanosine triphosphatase [Sulfitobacter noctilucicola]KIN62581.1 Deoxyguanosinetriphosphate triphosphohydrolase-like protein [Sulfitobacter noctilucicola]MBB4172886.1 dGTPase [Sulfitobacter noctilucicola]